MDRRADDGVQTKAKIYEKGVYMTGIPMRE